MKLFVLRHGEAVPFAASDAERALTDAGAADVREVLRLAAEELREVGRLLASPLLRAQQTASLVAEQLRQNQKLRLNVETSDLLRSEGSLEMLAEWLQQQFEKRPLQPLLLVSHQPLVGHFIDWFSGAPHGKYFMGTSAMACLEFDVVAASCAELLWLRQPGRQG